MNRSQRAFAIADERCDVVILKGNANAIRRLVVCGTATAVLAELTGHMRAQIRSAIGNGTPVTTNFHESEDEMTQGRPNVCLQRPEPVFAERKIGLQVAFASCDPIGFGPLQGSVRR